MNRKLLLRFLVCLCLNLVLTKAAISEKIVTISLKSSVDLKCPVAQDEFPQWFKVDLSGKETEIFFTPNRYDFPKIDSLKITNILATDEGNYHCKIAFTDDVKKIFKLSLSQPKTEYFSTTESPGIDKLQWTRIPYSQVTIDSTRFAVIPCKAVGENVVVSIYKMNKDGSVKRKLKGSAIIIHRPKISDSGDYKCIAENGAGKIEHQFKIAVRQNGNWGEWGSWSKCSADCGYGFKERKRECNDPPPAGGGLQCYGRAMDRQRCRKRSCQFPKMTKFGYEITDDALILSCAGKGLPKPIAEWKYSTTRLGKTSDDTGQLKIPKGRAKPGYYTCKLHNQAGYFTVSIEISEI